MIRNILALLLCLAGLSAADVTPVQVKSNGWTMSLDDRRVVIARGEQAVGTTWLFQCRFGPWTKAADGSWCAAANQGGKDVAQVTIALDPAGRLRLSSTAPAGTGPTLLVGLASTLAQDGLKIDGAPFAIPASADDAKRVWSLRKDAVLFAGQADRRLGLAVVTAKDASVRDLRGGREGLDLGRFDFAFYLHAAADGKAVVEFDLTQAGAKP